MPLLSRTVRLAVVDSTPEDYVDLLAATGTPNISLHFLFSGCNAINFARRWQMSLWVVNARLCDMSGFELAKKLRWQRPNATVFIIGNEYDLADELQTMTLGLTKYLCKPLEPSWVLPRADESSIPFSAAQDAPRPRSYATTNGQPNFSESELGTEASTACTYPRDGVILPFDSKYTRRPAA
jgi:CheY-like chemotaxis protein